ncbi:MAG: nucleotidyltransferase domain-containing protein [Chloroflexota bacterium]
MDATTKLPEITRRIVEASQPEKIILFGSHARGDSGPDSDLDLLVVVPGVERPRAESTRLRRVLRGLLVPIDIVVATPEQIERLKGVRGLIYHTALSQGKVVYERATS